MCTRLCVCVCGRPRRALIRSTAESGCISVSGSPEIVPRKSDRVYGSFLNRWRKIQSILFKCFVSSLLILLSLTLSVSFLWLLKGRSLGEVKSSWMPDMDYWSDLLYQRVSVHSYRLTPVTCARVVHHLVLTWECLLFPEFELVFQTGCRITISIL